MKISETPTNHILVKASTNSEWDCCDFALITCSDAWVKDIEERLSALSKVQSFIDFWSLKFFDYSVGFFQSADDNASELLSEIGNEKKWVFVELEEGEEDNLERPETTLDCHHLSLNNEYEGRYIAYGKYTGEEFFTEPIPVGEIAALLSQHYE